MTESLSGILAGHKKHFHSTGGRLSRTLCVALLALLEFVFPFSLFYLSIYSIYRDLYLLMYIKRLDSSVIISYI